MVTLINTELGEHGQGYPAMWSITRPVTHLNFDQAKRWHQELKDTGKSEEKVNRMGESANKMPHAIKQLRKACNQDFMLSALD